MDKEPLENSSQQNNLQPPEQAVLESKDPVVTEKQKEKKPVKVPRLKAELLTELSAGLFKLYKAQSASINKMKNYAPDSFVAAILNQTRSWSQQLLPRYEYSYFLERMQVVGRDFQVANFLSKLRMLHVGDIKEDEFNDIYAQKTKSLLDLINDQMPLSAKEQRTQTKVSNAKSTLDPINIQTKYGKSIRKNDFISKDFIIDQNVCLTSGLSATDLGKERRPIAHKSKGHQQVHHDKKRLWGKSNSSHHFSINFKES